MSQFQKDMFDKLNMACNEILSLMKKKIIGKTVTSAFVDYGGIAINFNDGSELCYFVEVEGDDLTHNLTIENLEEDDPAMERVKF